MGYLQLPVFTLTLVCSLVLTLMPSRGDAETKTNGAEITLSAEEVKFVKWLSTTDEMVKSLTKQGELLDWLNKLIGVVPGPIGIVQKWNMATIKGWRAANKKLVGLKKQVHCAKIQELLAGGTENTEFFEKLYEARGCEED
ncbi:MAG: hypothetical protein E8D52_06845 [Nitrospira sp.]|nr:MAG: hypothetical protein E8D52_06845 [Nitrospira sp.]